MKKEYWRPLMSCEEARELERVALGDDEKRVREAMAAAGAGIAKRVIDDFSEARGAPPREIVCLAGKGHNGGDALIALYHLAGTWPDANLRVFLGAPRESLKPLTRDALTALEKLAARAGRLVVGSLEEVSAIDWESVDLCLEGLLGLGFAPPMDAPLRSLAEALAARAGRSPVVASVDLPAGLGDERDETPMRADFSYLTGVAKSPAFLDRNWHYTGRLRFIDLGFGHGGKELDATTEGVLLPEVLNNRPWLRPILSEKRRFGHLFLVGGARAMTGAIQMATLASLKSGVGLATAFVPGMGASRLASAVPEAMWMALPTNEEGSLKKDALTVIRNNLRRASALVIGPGLEIDRETRSTVSRLVREVPLPMVIDATALVPEMVSALAGRGEDAGPVVLTPHLGEFARLQREESASFDAEILREFCARERVITVLKGPLTRICDGRRLVHSPFGGPVLARGGSGDLLAGMIGARLAQWRGEGDAFEAVAEVVAWHGMAADALAREYGHHSVRTTELLDFLPVAMRSW